MNGILRFRIAYQIFKDFQKITVILTLLFMGIAVMYAGFYPAFKDMMTDMLEGFEDSFNFVPGVENMDSYAGFLNIELYQIFWILILGILIAFIAATNISKEIEGKTIDLLMSNPVSRKQIVVEKFLGIIPMIVIINFGTMLAVIGVTAAIGEELDLSYLFMTHIISILYFLAIASIGILISVIIDEKMKAAIFSIALLIGMFVFRSISLMIPDYESLGYISLTHYFNPADILMKGEVDPVGVIVLTTVVLISMIIAMLYFEHRDIAVA